MRCHRASSRATAVLGTAFLAGSLFLVTNPGGFAASAAGASAPATVPLPVDPTPPTLPTPPAPPKLPAPAVSHRAIHVGNPHPAPDEAVQPLWIEVLGQLPDGTPVVTNTTAVGFTPAAIKKYLGLTGTGAGVTIAIVDAYDHPSIAADLATFDTTFGLPAPASFKKVSQTGSS